MAIIEDMAARMARVREGHARKFAWPQETIAKVRELAEAGLDATNIARQVDIDVKTLRDRAPKLGIAIGAEQKQRREAGDAVLREFFPTIMDQREIHKRWCEATGQKNRSKEAMRQVAMGRLGLRRDGISPLDSIRIANAARSALRARQRAEKAVVVREMIEAGQTRAEIVRSGVVARETLRAMMKQKLVVFPAYVPKPKAPPAPKPPKLLKVRAVKPKTVRAAQAAPLPRPNAAWAPADPDALPARVETVEEYLARGGRVTRCPTAILVATQATVSAEERAVIAAHHAKREAEYGKNWVQQKNNMIARAKAKAAAKAAAKEQRT